MPATSLITALLTLAPESAGQSCPTQVLQAPSAMASDGFGRAISVDGGRMAVGTPGTFNNPSVGSVHVHERAQGGWVAVESLSPPDPMVAGDFGFELAVLGETLAVADPGSLHGGEVHVYDRSSGAWTLVQTLAPVSRRSRIALTDDELIVSNPLAGSDGEVHVYDRATWNRVTLLPPPEVLTGMGIPLFGQSLAVHGDNLAVSFAYQVFDGAQPTRFVLFDRGSGAWTYTTNLGFGDHGRVHVDGGNMVVAVSHQGNPSYSDLFFYRLVGGTWSLTQSETRPGGYSNLVGDGHRIAGSVPGDRAEVWELASGSWSLSAPALPPTTNDQLGFGIALAMEAEELFVSTDPHYLLYQPHEVHVFSLGPQGQNRCVMSTNSTGGSARISSSGCNSVGANDLVLSASPVPDSPGLFFYGEREIHAPFGDGVRCVGGAVGRMPLTQAAGHTLAWNVDLTRPPSAATQVTVGSIWYFQAWFRDVDAGGAGFNLSDALRLEFRP